MNRLGSERSPYLRQHADNPVDWYPWGPEALERAKREDKPILLSVGYSACHWCHVMAHESFEDAATAQVMNAHFVNVKVDREERPDVDQLYQGVVQLMGRGGGWPLTVFLTPALRPFFGGTYFPKEPRHGLPSFRALVSGIAEAWKNDRQELENESLTFEQGLREFTTLGLDGQRAPWTVEALRQAGEKMAAVIDPRHGGFGAHGPKFPNPMNLAFLLRAWRRGANARCRDGALFTLEKLCLGGIHDQLGGGFHRYSVDERWLVPHFEKMLYDNAQLLHLLAEAWLIAPRPLWHETAERLVGWLTREMTSPEGTFFSAQDADSEGEEGKFFVWTPAQLREALGNDADAELLCRHFDVTPGGNFEEHSDASVLSVGDARLGDTRLEVLRLKLFEARRARVAPGLDDKVLAGWNGLMIRALAAASAAFQRDDWAALATRAASAWLVGDPARLERAPGLTGVLEDYGDLISGLVALFQRTQEPRLLARAEALADAAYDLFWDDQQRAWRAAPKHTSDLVVTPWAVHDNAFPSGASTLTEAQVALTALTGRPRHLERAAVYLERLQGEALRNPLAFGHLLIAADLLVDGAAELTLVAPAERLRAWRGLLAQRWLPTLSVVAHEQGTRPPPVLDELLSQRGGAGAFLCQHFACRLPVDGDEALVALLAPFS